MLNAQVEFYFSLFIIYLWGRVLISYHIILYNYVIPLRFDRLSKSEERQ